MSSVLSGMIEFAWNVLKEHFSMIMGFVDRSILNAILGMYFKGSV